MNILPAAEIPTVSLLYHLRKLVPTIFAENEEAPKPSQSLNDRIGLIRGDITHLGVDAIVNAANNSLRGGGGVDGAIHRAAGRELLKECRTLGGCDTGSAKITGAYNLPCKKVIHAVGPVYNPYFKEDSAEDLASCYTTSLELAVQNDCKTIAFSALSTGIYGYPSKDAAPVAIKAVKQFLEGKHGDKLEKVVFCTFVQNDVDAYDYWLPRFFPTTEPIPEHEPEAESDWEEIEGGESAENGPPPTEGAKGPIKPISEEMEDVLLDVPSTELVEDEPAVKEAAAEYPSGAADEEMEVVALPDVPTAEPLDDGPATKKLKQLDEEKL